MGSARTSCRLPRAWPVAALALALALPSAARATDGHFLHGVGAINSAMGGAGVAASGSLLGALYVNPAGLLAFRGTRTELGFEMFKATRAVRSAVGPFAGRTESSSEFTPVPAFAWSQSLRDDRLVVAVGGLGIGGFGVDYPADPRNPMLAPRPNGFGSVYSNFQLLRIAPAVAWAVTPRLSVGVALDIDWASLAVDPMPTAAPAADPGPDGVPGTPDDRAFYSSASDADGAFGIGGQLGVRWAATDRVALGAAYTSPQRFQRFEWDAVSENPNLPSYNQPRAISFRMDMPAIYSVGAAVAPSSRLLVAADVRYLAYASTPGFRDEGFRADGSVRGFGWRDIWVAAVGGQLAATRHVTLRAGYNFSQNPVPDAQSMFNIPAPAVVQHHATAGLGFTFRGGFGVDVAYYRAFENSITGPMVRPDGALPGTQVTSTMAEQSLLLGFRFAPRETRP